MNATQQVFITLLDELHIDYKYIEDDKNNMILYANNSEVDIALIYFHICLVPIIIVVIDEDIFMGYDDGSLYDFMIDITDI